MGNHCPNLLRLNLEGDPQITKEGFSHLEKCEFLQDLNLSRHDIEVDEIQSLAKIPLKILALGHCTGIAPDVVKTISQVFPQLRELKLLQSSIMDDGLKELKIPGIFKLILAETAITDAGVQEIARSCAKLQYIDLSGCEQV